MKTMQQWNESNLELSKFLKIGDIVDQDIADYFIEVLPPTTMNSSIIQIGEPYDHNGENGRARYDTLQKKDGQWVYIGFHAKRNY
jgi:hypothetical protein